MNDEQLDLVQECADMKKIHDATPGAHHLQLVWFSVHSSHLSVFDSSAAFYHYAEKHM